MWYSQRNKYGAIKTTHDGHVYDSKLEAKHAQNLDFRKKGKLIKGWTRQCKIDLYYYDSMGVKYSDKSWKVDFLVEEKDGTFTLEEVKGLATNDFLAKERLLKNVWLHDHPNYKYKIYYAKDI